MVSWKIIYEFFILLLIVNYAILIVFVPENHSVLTPEFLLRLDWGLIIFFGMEYLVRLWMAPNKKKFILSNWFDLLAMIPVNSGFRFVRLLRLLRLIRLMKTSPMLWNVLKSRHIQMILLVTTGVMLWSAAGIFLLEKDINSSVSTFGDAFWWAVVTTTTVGYGDISPVTAGGRILAIILMITGIGLIGTITANLANQWMAFFRGETPDAFQQNDKPEENKNELEEHLQTQVMDWTSRLHELNDKEYETLLQTMELLRKKR